MAITGIGHLAVVVSDMKKSSDFYTGILGFSRVFEIHDDQGNPWIVYFRIAKGQFIELFHPRGEAARDAQARVGFSHICYLVDDLKATEAEIIRRGGALEKPIKLGKDGNWQGWIRDPDGNRIELMQIMPGSPHEKAGA